MRLPDFVIIGAQKSATTWLQQALMKHEQVFMPTHEAHFLNNSFPVEEYAALFEEARDKQIVGEKTPDYLHVSEARIARFKELCPEAKLIVVLRHPVHRAWSQARMEVSAHNASPLSWRDRWLLALHVGLHRNTRRTEYAQCLGRWLRFFPRKQLHVLFYEKLFADPHRSLEHLFSFLRIDALSSEEIRQIAGERVWPSQAAVIPEHVRLWLERRYASQAVDLCRMGFAVPASWPRPETIEGRTLVWSRLRASILPGGLGRLGRMAEWGMRQMGRVMNFNAYRLYDRMQQWRAWQRGANW